VTDQRPPDVDIRKAEHENLTRAHGLDLKLLQPWHGVDAPFSGAWCVLRPGDASEPHAHHEPEIFIAMTGRAQVAGDGRCHEIVAGDIVFVRPGVEHRVVNEHDEDFSYYAIWWDRAMSQEFLTRADGQARPDHAEAGRRP
jgi:mannose-6-phosphate isomerase-like protein (cupin superfamily)